MTNHNHRMVIYRGLPGSGKTTIATLEQHSQAKDCACEIFEADHYFMKDGVYHFDPGKIGLAHSDCARRVMDHGRSPSTLCWQMSTTGGPL
jgi:hypothetical protein